MAAYTFTIIDGCRVEVNVAAAFNRMAAAFQKATGYRLIIRSGTRTDAEQEAIFRARYVTAATRNGRRVYDTRFWRGQLWYRISDAGTVATPGTSNHQANGPIGPRALDLGDTGPDRGVSSFGTARNAWMQRNAASYGFTNAGNAFNEAWHKEYRGKIGGPAPTGTMIQPTPATKPAPTPAPTPTPLLEEIMALKSAVIAAQHPSSTTQFDGTIIDVDTEFLHSWSGVAESYNATMAKTFTESGVIKITRKHYDALIRDFKAYVAARRAHELAVAAASK